MQEVKRVEKPWGHELWWAQTEHYVGKLLLVREGHKLSLQLHVEKDETIFLQRGRLLLLVEEAGEMVERVLTPGEAYRIRPGTRHRMVALSECEIFEASTPQVEDVVRLEDAYGRADSKKA